MTRPMTFRRVQDDREASFLMPAQSRGIHLVLCCDARAPAVEKARELAPDIDIPSEWDLVLLDPTEATETAKWFGLGEGTAMAAIHDGALLAVEFECSREAFQRVVDVAIAQAAQLDEKG